MNTKKEMSALASLVGAKVVVLASRSRFPVGTSDAFTLALVFALAVCASVNLSAGIMGPIVTVAFGTDANDLETAAIDFGNAPDPIPDKYTWVLAEPQELKDSNGRLIGTIENLDLTLDADPMVVMNFAVAAGNYSATFNISSAVVSFPPLTNPDAFASAGFVLTDGSPSPGNGMSVKEIAPNNGLYTAEYNGGTEYAAMLATQVSMSPGTIASASDTEGFAVLNDTVSSIQSRFDFRLSANDRLAGNGRFEVIPEPSSLIIVMAGLLVGCWITRKSR